MAPKKQRVCVRCPTEADATKNSQHIGKYAEFNTVHTVAGVEFWWAFDSVPSDANKPLPNGLDYQFLLDKAQDIAGRTHEQRSNRHNKNTIGTKITIPGSDTKFLISKQALDVAVRQLLAQRSGGQGNTATTGPSQPAAANSPAAQDEVQGLSSNLQTLSTQDTDAPQPALLASSSSAPGGAGQTAAQSSASSSTGPQGATTATNRQCGNGGSHRDVKGLTTLPDTQVIRTADKDHMSSGPLLKKQTPETKHPKAQGGRDGFNNNPGVEILTNHFEISIPSGKVLYEYRVVGLPDSATRQKKRVLILDMLEMDASLYSHRTELATDYKTKIISCVPLFGRGNAPLGAKNPSITLNSYTAGNRTAAPTQVTLHLTLAAKHSLDGLLKYVSGKDVKFQESGVVEAMNIIIAKAVADPADPKLTQDTFQGNNNRFYFRPGWEELSDPQVPSIASAGIIATRGYYASVRPAMGGVLLNVNLVCGAFHRPWTLAQYMQAAPSAASSGDIQKHLAGLRVWVDFERASRNKNDKQIDDTVRRTKTLRELGNFPKRQLMRDNNGYWTTVWDHLRAKYRGKPGEPQLADEYDYTGNVGESKGRNDGANTKYYLARQLKVLADQPYRGTMDPGMTEKMIKFAQKKPSEVRNAIMGEGIASLKIAGHFSSPMLKKLGITINPQMALINAHKLPTPKIKFRGAEELETTPGFFNVADPASVKFGSSAYGFNAPKQMSATVQFFRLRPKDGHPKASSEQCIDSFMASSASTVIQKLKLLTVDRNLKCIDIDEDGFHEQTLTSLEKLLANPCNDKDKNKHRRPDLAVLLFTRDDPANRLKYSLFKIVTDQLLGMKSICLKEGNVEKQKYFFNLSMKLNLRCGNYNHHLVKPLLVPSMMPNQCNTLILGADVTHPSGSDSGGTPSIAALVGSVDAHFAKFSGSMRLNKGGQEIIECMQAMAEERIEEWYRLNENRMPARILFYRDGVDEGQFDKVRKQEVKAIKDAHKAVAARYKLHKTIPEVKLTVVVVTKRHNTRFFPKSAGSKTGNCQVGTLVDSGITSPYILDFFLLSHNVLVGTGRPAHYYVLENGMDLTVTNLQKTTFELCFTYGRSTTSVSYVPPAYYADRLCERGSLYLKPLKDRVEEAEKEKLKKGGPGVLSEDEVIAIARNLFYRAGRGRGLSEGEEGNPWHKDHDGKMFWM